MKCAICKKEFKRTEEEAKQEVDICPDCNDDLNYCSDDDIKEIYGND